MRLSIALLAVAACLSYSSAFNIIAEEAAAAARHLSKGNRACAPLNGTSLLIAEPHQISRIFLDPPSRTLLKRTPYIGGLDCHANRHRVYWSEISTGRINARNLRGARSFTDEAVYTELSPKQWRPRAIAIDFVADNLYVLDTRGKKVHVLDLESNLRTVIFEGGQLKAPTDIAIDPAEAVMFIADDTRILRFNMDGSDMRPIVSHPRYHIKALTLDSANKRIFWSDVAYHRIKSANYDGTGVRVLVKNEIGRSYNVLGPAQLSYYNGSLYFYDDVYRTISALELPPDDDGLIGKTEATAAKVYDRVDVRSIRVLNPARQASSGRNPCDDAGCQQLCLIAKKVEGRVLSKCALAA